MKINARIFSLPPYISTSWNNVVAIHMKGGSLIVSLVDGDMIEIPHLNEELIDRIFAAHAAFLEYDIARDHSNHSHSSNKLLSATNEEGEFPFRLGISGMDTLGNAMQHNPAQANAPDIPKEILQKIGAIARIVAPEDPNELPQAEPHCNCMHCQIARAMAQQDQNQEEESKEKPAEEPIVTDEELKFRQWTIVQTGEKLFNVINTLNDAEKYSVYLGDPVGCTCGMPGCEHILAVLKS